MKKTDPNRHVILVSAAGLCIWKRLTNQPIWSKEEK